MRHEPIKREGQGWAKRLRESQGWNAPLLLAALVGCGGSGSSDIVGPPPPPPPTAAIVEVISGNAQTAPVGQQLAVPIRVRVMTQARAPIAQQIVNFVVVQGGGSVFAGAALTDANGEAIERWTLGTTAGAQIMEARAVDQSSGDPITFAQTTATATPGAVATLTLRRQDTLAFLNTGLELAALVQSATDQYGNAVPSPALTVTGPGAYVVAGGNLTPSAEADLAVNITAGTAAAPVTIRARRDLRTLGGWDVTYGCRNGYGRMSPPELEQRYGMSDWVLLSYDAVLQVDSVVYGTGPMDPTMRYDAVVWVSGSASSQWQKYQGAIFDAITQPILTTPLALWQEPDALLFRRAGTINSGGPASRASWQGSTYVGADLCFAVNEGLYDAGIFRGTNGEVATEGSFLPAVLAP